MEMLRALTREVLAGTIESSVAAKRAAALGRGGYVSTFRGGEVNGHHLLMTRCAANQSRPREDGPPYFFRDSDIRHSLEQLDGINVAWPVADGVVQERIWEGPLPEGIGDHAYLGSLSLSPEELEAQSKVQFIRGIDDLDVEVFANLRMHGRPVRLTNRPPMHAVDVVCIEAKLHKQTYGVRPAG